MIDECPVQSRANIYQQNFTKNIGSPNKFLASKYAPYYSGIYALLEERNTHGNTKKITLIALHLYFEFFEKWRLSSETLARGVEKFREEKPDVDKKSQVVFVTLWILTVFR